MNRAGQWTCGLVLLAFCLVCLCIAVYFLTGTLQGQRNPLAYARVTQVVMTPVLAESPRTPTPVPPQAQLDALAHDQFQGGVMTVTLENGVATVNYAVVAYASHTDMFRQIEQNVVAFAPRAFALPAVDTLVLAAYADTTDNYGNKSKAVAATYTIPRATAEKIQWQTVDPRRLWRVLDGKNGNGTLRVNDGLVDEWVRYDSPVN